MSEEQKEARRQMMAKAALEREKAWDRRVASGRSGKNDKSVSCDERNKAVMIINAMTC